MNTFSRTDPGRSARAGSDDGPLSHDAFRVALTDALRPLSDPADIQAEAARLLGTHLGASRALYAETDEGGEYVVLHRDYVDGVPSVVGRHRLDQFGAELMNRLRAGCTLAVADVADARANPQITEAERRAYEAVGVRSYLAVPLVKDARLVAYLGLHQAEPREWSDAEIALVEEIAERTWSAVERARSEAALRDSEEKYRLLFDSIDQGFCTIDMVFDEAGRPCDYVFVEVNRAFTAQTDLHEAEGKSMLALRPGHEPHWFEVYGRIALTGEPERFESHAAELGRWYSVYAFRIGDPKLRRVAVLFEDISQRKSAEAALVEADRRKDEFLATLAHELRNPLAPIRTGLELMKLVEGDAEQVERVRAKMEKQVQQLTRLVDDLLEVSRIRSGTFQLRTEPVQLHSLVHGAIDATRPIVDAAGHELVVDLPREPLWLRADPTRLTQILSNLLTNAARYTPGGGRIVLAAERNGATVTIAVRDTGIGIAPEVIERVFDMFWQGDRSEERSQGGLGIGLMLVKRLVEMHGGSVHARSDGLGQGSEFSVQLPVLADAPRPAPDERSAQREPSTGRRVLIADDNRDAADMLATLVQMLGHQVQTVYDGAEAVEVATAFAPEIVLLDLGMPVLDGFGAARRIRAQASDGPPTLVALTGWGQDDDRRRTREAGFDLHLVKPVTVEQLRGLLAAATPAASSGSGEGDREQRDGAE